MIIRDEQGRNIELTPGQAVEVFRRAALLAVQASQIAAEVAMLALFGWFNRKARP
jgi:hypothetical protein